MFSHVKCWSADILCKPSSNIQESRCWSRLPRRWAEVIWWWCCMSDIQYMEVVYHTPGFPKKKKILFALVCQSKISSVHMETLIKISAELQV